MKKVLIGFSSISNTMSHKTYDIIHQTHIHTYVYMYTHNTYIYNKQYCSSRILKFRI